MAATCDGCAEMATLLIKYKENCLYEDESCNTIDKNDLNVLVNYINIWNQKHCFCFLKEQLNLIRFNNLVQSIIFSSFNLLHEILKSIREPENNEDESPFNDWTQEEKEKLLQVKAKIFQLSFPLYVAYKHSAINKNEELSTSDKRNISLYCDLSDFDMPFFLLRKIIYFIDSDGITLYTNVLGEASPCDVSIVFVHSMICVIQTIKQYFNPAYITIKLVVIRCNVINYLCKMQDNDLRILNNRNMFEYVWSVIKEYNSFNQFQIDKDGLRIALKYFNSSTLTMRLSGIAQINSYIGLYNDMHHATSKIMSEQLNMWIIENKIIENIFGPNLHVEVLKQSHYILSCTSPKITTGHIDIIWGSAQIKHYERYIFEILSQLVKNFNVVTVLHLYNLLWKIKPKDQSEHTLNLASQITKYIWSHNNVQPDMLTNIHYIPNEKPLLEEAAFNKNPLYSFFRAEHMNKVSSNSSESSVEVSDDEEEEDEFLDIDLSERGLCIDKGQISKLNSEESSNTSDSDIDELNEFSKESLQQNYKQKLDYSMLSTDDQGMDLNFENESQDAKVKKDKIKEDKNCANEDSFDEGGNTFESIYEEGGDILKTCYNFAKSQVAARNKQQQQQQQQQQKPPTPESPYPEYVFKIDDVCKPGNTLLWDILQDNMLNDLSEETYLSAEKIFWNTIVCASNRAVRRSFIFACLDNLAKNYSVLMSIRLLMKLYGSFQQQHIRKLLSEADAKKSMMKSFFSNLTLYMSCCKFKNDQFDTLKSKFHSHKEEIQYRLNFLSYIYCYGGTYEGLAFSHEHINILWHVFTTSDYSEIVEEFFDWLLSQVKRNILNIELITYILVEKMPLLPSEAFSLTSLELLHSLHGYVLTKNLQNKCNSVKYVVNILWSVAFQNPNSEVSMNAIRNLNSYYISLLNCSSNFDAEEEFIYLCVKHLKNASLLLPIDCDKSLVIIDRAVILLKNHLEVFQGRYSFFFRKMKLTSDHDLTIHRIRNKTELIMRFWVISPCNSDKRLFELAGTEHVGDLRAEVQCWWHSLVSDTIAGSSTDSDKVPETLICLVYHEQEIPFEFDDKRLCDVGFKDGNIHQLSFHTCKQTLSKATIAPLTISSEFFDSFKHKNSKTLLLESGNFELLFTLMQQLDMINITKLKARILSRNIWEIVQMLPTSSEILQRFDRLTELYNEHCKIDDNFQGEDVSEFGSLFEKIFPTDSNQKLIYSCQIVDYYRVNGKNWPQIFIRTGGLNFLYKLFIEKVDSIRYSREWTEWKQDCMASLIQTIYQSAICPFGKTEIAKAGDEKIGDICFSFMSSTDAAKRNKRPRKNSLEKNTVYVFNSKFLSMITNPEKLLRVLMSILKHVSLSCKLVYPTAHWTRAQVVFFNLTFFTSWCYSDLNVFDIFFRHESSKETMQSVICDDSDLIVRKEACQAFSRLCLGSASDGKNVRCFVPKFLKLLLSFLDEASKVNIEKIAFTTTTARTFEARTNKGCFDQLKGKEKKDLPGPGCNDYFALICRLIEAFLSQNSTQPCNIEIDINGLCQFVADSILKRENYESRKNGIEDEGLKGLLGLLSTLIKLNPCFKKRPECKDFILEIFNCLFALPTQTQRGLPKCKADSTRSSAFDLLVELVKGNESNFTILANALMNQHRHEIIGRNTSYPWEYWPREESRSECGFVGLTNLGATCYLASCMQHLFMLTEVRNCVLSAHLASAIKHDLILRELQKMFIFLQESERKAYSPKNFCKAYTMDHQPLNICEQKDMTEFFTDLISKMEEMTIDLKDMVKKNFSGLQSNNVVSLDCPHISQTTEEFYSLRCQVSDMKDLYESLNELTVKDTLEGDNMYNCSKCGKKVRAEKRACIKKLPKILCFNTMRYTFNMVTMTKEKVNTHFSFPFNLDMSPYLEKNLLNITDAHDGHQFQSDDVHDDASSTKYELIGVTVHTGTAEGGHYYSFIQDRNPQSATRNRWFLFNDAEVKSFDKTQIATECFGGETTSKQYDQTNDKFFDCSIEKTNSAYMLFYERIDDANGDGDDAAIIVSDAQNEECVINVSNKLTQLTGAANNGAPIYSSLMDWIWDDNLAFLRDQFIFQHNYFDFLWNICAQVPQTLSNIYSIKSNELAAQLATHFVLETLIHSKEKPSIANWIELLTKQFNNSANACEWFFTYLADCDWWPIQILFKCSNQMVRQLFVRLLVHVITKLRNVKLSQRMFLHHLNTEELKTAFEQNKCTTRFVQQLLSLIDIENLQTKPNIKNLTEYFSLFVEYAKQGEEECGYLLSIDAITTMVTFYMNHTKVMNEFVDAFSDNEDEDFEERPHIFGPMGEDKFPRMASLDKMLMLIVCLVEKTQSNLVAGTTKPLNALILSPRDFDSLTSGKSFLFIQQQIRDNINPRQTFNLINALFRLDDSLAPFIMNMIFSSIVRMSESTAPFFKILTFIADSNSMFPYFSKLILSKIWEICQHNSLQMLEWLIQHVSRNKLIHEHVLSTLDNWLIYFLIEDSNIRVRSNAAHLVTALVHSEDNSFRTSYRPFRSYPYTIKLINLEPDSVAIVDKLFTFLITFAKKLKNVSFNQPYGTQKLTNYFFVMSYLLIYTKQKRLFVTHFTDFWTFFSSKLAEPAIAIHQNKQAFLMFWYLACQEHPECIKCIIQNPNVSRKIAFNYILADHEDQDTVLFNRNMLPYYYGILRLCCQNSRSFTRYLGSHQNIQWAFQNITPHHNQYQLAVNELFKLMKMFSTLYPDSSEDEINDVMTFKKNTMKLYLGSLNPTVNWSTLIHVLNILLDTAEDYVFLLQCNGLGSLYQCFSALNIMFHEATACHVTNELIDVLRMISAVLEILDASPRCRQASNPQLREYRTGLKDFIDPKKFMFLLNSYTPEGVRNALLDVFNRLIHAAPHDFIKSISSGLLIQHILFHDHPNQFVNGPYFPKRGQKVFQSKSSIRPSRPTFQMCFGPTILEAVSVRDKDYERTVYDLYYYPYYSFIDDMFRYAAKLNIVFLDLAELVFRVADESVYFHCKKFINTLLEINGNSTEYKCWQTLNEHLMAGKAFKEYIAHILTRERTFLHFDQVFEFMNVYLFKVSKFVLTPHLIKQVLSLIDGFCLTSNWVDLKVAQQIIGDLRAIKLIYLCGVLDNQSETINKLCDNITKLKMAYSKLLEAEAEKMPPSKRIKFEAEPQSSSKMEDVSDSSQSDSGLQSRSSTSSTVILNSSSNSAEDFSTSSSTSPPSTSSTALASASKKNSSDARDHLHTKLITSIDDIIFLIKSTPMIP